MRTTRLIKDGDSQAVLIPDELAYENVDVELEIERVGDEIRIRPRVGKRSLEGLLRKFAAFSPEFMNDGRGEHEQDERLPRLL